MPIRSYFLMCCLLIEICQAQLRLINPPIGTICTNTETSIQNFNRNRANYTYRWDMGDGTILTDSGFVYHTYTQPGTYTVRFTMTGPLPAYVLRRVVIHEIPSPIIWQEQGADLNGPDLSLDVIDQVGMINIYDKIKRNTRGVLPQTFTIDKVLDPRAHDLIFEEWDLLGQDDPLGTLRNLPLAAGTFRDTIPHGANGILDISWVMDTVSSLADSIVITVNQSPTPARLRLIGDSAICPGETTQIVAMRDPGSRNEWFKNSASVSTSQSDTLLVTVGGGYHLRSLLNGCYVFSADTIRIAGYSVPQADISFVGDTVYICGDTGFVSLQCNHNDPRYNYQWLYNGAAIPNATQPSYGQLRAQEGNYQVIVDAPGDCINDTSRMVYAKRVPLVKVSIYLRSGPTGDTIFASTPGYQNYQWYVDGNEFTVTLSTPYLVLPNGVFGTIQLKVYDGTYLCWGEFSNSIMVVSRDPLLDPTAFQLFPNPATRSCQINVNQIITRPVFYMYNTSGEAVAIFREKTATHWKLDVSNLNPGLYMVTGLDHKGRLLGNRKLVILPY